MRLMMSFSQCRLISRRRKLHRPPGCRTVYGDELDVARGSEPIELEVLEVEDNEVSDDEGDAADESTADESTTAVSEAAVNTAAVAVLRRLCEEAEERP